jgi:hypothetical protein
LLQKENPLRNLEIRFENAQLGGGLRLVSGIEMATRFASGRESREPSKAPQTRLLRGANPDPVRSTSTKR